jgi:dTDP-4-dehydrorhamnose reductase
MSETPAGKADSGAKPRILILGFAGQLGRELERIFAGAGPITAVDREMLDLRDPERTRALVRRVAPDLILNAAAYTAVDRAEDEPALAHAINGEAPRILAEEAKALGALFVHYSTDYVFDGSKSAPWVETDGPNPLNVYGRSKLQGEQAVQKVGGRYLIFRTSWLYGPRGNNFLLTMLRLARERGGLTVVDDQIGAPTTSVALARATYVIVSGVMTERFGVTEKWAGLYHMTCAGSVSWFGFAQAIFKRAGAKAPELVAIASKDYPTRAVRPHNSVLSNARLKARFGVELPGWEAALDEAMRVVREVE